MKVVNSDRVASSPAPLVQGMQAGGFVFVSGQIGRDRETGDLVRGSFAEEVIQALRNVREIVEAAGGTIEDICKVNVYITDAGYGKALNEAYKSFFDSQLPARTTVVCSLLNSRAKVEIDAIAHIEAGAQP